MEEELKAKIKECYQKNFPNSFIVVCKTPGALKPKIKLGNHFCGYDSLCRRINKR